MRQYKKKTIYVGGNGARMLSKSLPINSSTTFRLVGASREMEGIGQHSRFIAKFVRKHKMSNIVLHFVNATGLLNFPEDTYLKRRRRNGRLNIVSTAALLRYSRWKKMNGIGAGISLHIPPVVLGIYIAVSAPDDGPGEQLWASYRGYLWARPTLHKTI